MNSVSCGQMLSPLKWRSINTERVLFHRAKQDNIVSTST